MWCEEVLPASFSPAKHLLHSCDVNLPLLADSPSAPVNVTVKLLKANSAVVTWDVLEEEVVIGFAISQQVGGKIPSLKTGLFARSEWRFNKQPMLSNLSATLCS